MNVTKQTKIAITDSKPNWHVVDVKGKVLGRVATEIADLLMGKGKTSFVRNYVVGDKVIVINASFVELTRDKAEKKMYYWHSGFPGGLSQETFATRLVRRPGQVIVDAVRRMLPVNRLTSSFVNNLYVYPGEEHPHQGQAN